jgi:hypothetical protein
MLFESFQQWLLKKMPQTNLLWWPKQIDHQGRHKDDIEFFWLPSNTPSPLDGK